MRKTMLALAVLAAWIAGCSGESGPKLVPVTGTVTMNNKPLAGAIIQFAPDATNKDARPAEDTTGSEGNYKLMTRGRSGVAPGKYKVVIVKSLAAPAAAPTGAFADDPFMAELSASPPDAKKTKAGGSSGKIEAFFDREVEPQGGVHDFDVKATSSSSGEAAKSSN